MMDIDKKTEEMLIQALYRMKEEQYRYSYKKEARYWAELQSPLSLKNLLSTYTKDELSEIRQNLELKGLSTLKKQQLIDALATGIVENAYRVFNRFDDFRYQLVKRIVKGNGFSLTFDFDAEWIEYFRNRGIIFTGSLNGKKVLAIPPELISKFNNMDNKEFSKKIKRNTEWIHLAHGILMSSCIRRERLIIQIKTLLISAFPNFWPVIMILA